MARGRLRPTIVTWHDLDYDSYPVFPDLQILSEGDSWFTISGFPAYNLLFELRFHRHTRIVNCGLPGDTIKRMAQICRNRDLREALSSSGHRWDVILLSGGGNDLIDEAADVLLRKDQRDDAAIAGPADYCDPDKLRTLVDEVQEGFRRIAALRDAPASPSQGVPILTHTYDYATPRNAPARFLIGQLGPWLHRALTASEVPGGHWVAVADHLMDKLAEGILALESGPDPIPAFRVIDTRHTLKRAVLGHPGDSNDWQNEIHPNGRGYEKLAKRFERELEALLGSRWR
jgi:lysophospholipase L1-like esterase